MTAGALIKVQDKVYSVPAKATPSSMEKAALGLADPERARGYSKRNVYGRVRRVDKEHGLVVFENLSTGETEHCTLEAAQVVQSIELPERLRGKG